MNIFYLLFIFTIHALAQVDEDAEEDPRTSFIDPSFFDPWSKWTACSRSCGGGRRTRERFLTSENKDGTIFKQLRKCKTELCVETEGEGEGVLTSDDEDLNTFFFNPWSSWTACSKTCGGGRRNRFRERFLKSETRTDQNSKQVKNGTIFKQLRKCNTKTCD